MKFVCRQNTRSASVRRPPMRADGERKEVKQGKRNKECCNNNWISLEERSALYLPCGEIICKRVTDKTRFDFAYSSAPRIYPLMQLFSRSSTTIQIKIDFVTFSFYFPIVHLAHLARSLARIASRRARRGSTLRARDGETHCCYFQFGCVCGAFHLKIMWMTLFDRGEKWTWRSAKKSTTAERGCRG